MKKLLFATAIAASAAAFATDPFNAISFESYTLGATFANGGTEINDFGTGHFFYFDGESNSSVVTNESAVPADVTRPKWFADNGTGNNANYLALDTEGGTFWRSINNVSEHQAEGQANTYGLGAEQAVGDGIYLDTMVQFTVTEDEEPTVGADDKLAIWLGVVTNAQGEVTGTNLMVKAGYYDASSAFVQKTFTLDESVKEVLAGEWYRLTVSALDDVFNPNEEVKVPAFIIKIDGVEMQATEATINSQAVTESFAEILSSERKTQLSDGKVFLALTEGSAGDPTTLQGVGFQGTGAIDDLVLTTEDPFAGVVTTIDFTLTWDSEKVTGVQYTFGDLTTTNSLTSGTAVQLPVGDGTATIELIPTFVSGYEFDKVTMGEAELGLTFAIPGVTTNATLLAKAAAPAYPDYIDTTDTVIKGKYDAWKNAYQADTQSQWESAFLLNMDPTASVAEGTALLKIASITEVSGGWELEIVSDATTLTATDGTILVGNGYLRIIAADTLAGLTNATPSYIPVSVTSGKITVTVPTAKGKFMKAELTTEAPANN